MGDVTTLRRRSRHRELFILVGVIALDEQARRDRAEVAMHQLERATRDTIEGVGQTVIHAGVVPGDSRREAIVEVRFSGDRAGAIAALERWKTTVRDVAGATGILRTWLGGPDGLNLEWWDEEYNRELRERVRSADAETTRRISAHVPDEHRRPTRRSWLTDWDEAARHPRKTRLFLAASFAVLGVISAALAGDLTPWSLAVGATGGAAIGDYALRLLRARQRATDAD